MCPCESGLRVEVASDSRVESRTSKPMAVCPLVCAFSAPLRLRGRGWAPSNGAVAGLPATTSGATGH
eukprot:13327617-Alexandrium_andersonii.AAC.1